MIDRLPREQRTFETRLLFIKEIFENKFDNIDIMAHCIEHKLNVDYLKYNETLRKSVLNLTGKDPVKILKNLK